VNEEWGKENSAEEYSWTTKARRVNGFKAMERQGIGRRFQKKRKSGLLKLLVLEAA